MFIKQEILIITAIFISLFMSTSYAGSLDYEVNESGLAVKFEMADRESLDFSLSFLSPGYYIIEIVGPAGNILKDVELEGVEFAPVERKKIDSYFTIADMVKTMEEVGTIVSNASNKGFEIMEEISEMDSEEGLALSALSSTSDMDFTDPMITAGILMGIATGLDQTTNLPVDVQMISIKVDGEGELSFSIAEPDFSLGGFYEMIVIYTGNSNIMNLIAPFLEVISSTDK